MDKKKNQTYTTSKPSKVVENITDLAKLPPQAPELEAAVLGALLLESKSIEKIDLEPEDFYNEKNRIIFSAIESLTRKRHPVDILTVHEELVLMGALDEAGGLPYLAELSDISSAAHIEYHAKIIKQKSVARKLIIQSYNVMQRAYDESEDVQDTMEYLEQSFTQIRSGGSSTGYLDMPEAIKKTLNYLIRIQEKREQGGSVAIPTGLNSLDDQFNGGWSTPDFIILGGRPSMGKTQFALHFAKTASANGKYCLFISIEMTAEQLIMRILIEDERLNFHDMKTGQMDENEWRCIDEKVKEFESNRLYIADDHDVRYLSNIKTLARKLHREGKLDLLIIDYLQLIKTNQSFGTRDLEIGYITGELKNLAKELSIPVILLAQLRRPQKGTKVQVPVLDDLRESGNIEQDADKVIFPHRPSYYDPEAVDGGGVSWKNRGVLIIGKDREGPKDERIYFRTDDRFKKIYDDCYVQPSSHGTENEEVKKLPF